MERRFHEVPMCPNRLYVLVIAVTLALFPVAVQAQNVLTWHNDNSRTGQNLKETILTPANVNTAQFGKILSLPVDGQILGQPLYATNLKIAGGTHNVVWVATENDSVYAFDAGGNPATPLWQQSFIDPSAGVTTVPCADVQICGVISPVVGITSTPVLDGANATLYVVALTLENGNYVERLHALSATTGAEEFGGPVVIEASVPGTGAGSVSGVVAWDSGAQLQRAALLLADGVVYIASASYGGDQGPYHGWVLGYAANTLAQVGVFNVSPNARQGGIWGSGGGPVASADGYIYVLTANGLFDASSGGVDYGDSFLKLSTSGGLSVADYFTPDNQMTLDTQDIDLGAGTGMILPAAASGPDQEILGAGKQGILYVVNTSDMGMFNATSNDVIQTVNGSTVMCPGGTGSPAYFNNAVYYSGCGDSINMFSVSAGLLSTSPVSQSPAKYPVGSTPSISANGSTNGILWAISSQSTSSVLHAYNASNLADELYKTLLPVTHYAVPTVAGGRVYIGTNNALLVYGLL